jgi:RNA polymerase sigma factor (sigma-70 family)
MSLSPSASPLGDEAELFARHQPELWRAVRSQVAGPDAVVDDACAQAWLILLRRQPDRATVYPWLRTVAIREAWRLSHAHDGSETTLDALAERGPAVTLDGALLARAALRELESALSERQWHMLLLQAAGLRYAEIAARTGSSVRTVDRQLQRARARAHSAVAG